MNHYVRSVAQILVITAYMLLLSMTSHVAAQVIKRGESARKSQKRVSMVRFDSGDSALKIPLDIDNNIIRMRVSVNGSKPLNSSLIRARPPLVSVLSVRRN